MPSASKWESADAPPRPRTALRREHDDGPPHRNGRIDGIPLADTIGAAPLPPEAVAQIGAAVADAIHSIHAQEVIHLDLKPEKVLLRPSGEAVLLDFGFARHVRHPDLLELLFAAGSQPFGQPQSLAGMRDRLRRKPAPPHAVNAKVPPWL